MSFSLIGYRAVGKSSIAVALSHRLGFHFVCSDTLVEKLIGQSIFSFVQENGWSAFRMQEKSVIQNIAKQQKIDPTQPIVLATGGGVILDQENVALLKQIGRIYWLKAELSLIQERLKQEHQKRPSLLGNTSVWQEAQQILQQRMPLYFAAADRALDVTYLSIEEATKQIIEWENLF